jgi:hypothetical protein
MELKYVAFTFHKDSQEIFVLFTPLKKGTTYKNKYGDVIQAKYEVGVSIGGDMIGTWNTRQSPSVTTAKEFVREAMTVAKDGPGK